MEFSVLMEREVDLQDLRRALQTTLQKLLNLSFLPSIEIKESSQKGSSVGQESDTAIFEIAGAGDASLMLLELPYDDSAPLSKRLTAVLSAGSLRDAPSWASAIALSIALGQLMETKITDDSLLLSSTPEVDPAMILEKIRLRESHDDLLQASTLLLNNLDVL
jgi:hypothetical protein